MKYLSAVLACLLLISMVGCGEPRTIDGKYYDTVGIVNQLEGSKDPCIRYELSIGNTLWAIVTIESIVLPVYFFGWSIMNPVEKIPGCGK